MKKKLSYSIVIFAFFYSINIHAATPADECGKLSDENMLEQALTVCAEAANAGDAKSQTTLAEIYDQQGDSVKTALWWNRAANSGYQPARNLLAMKYYYGGSVFGPEKGWSKNYPEAFRIWQQDAEQGTASSQFMIGVMYFNGEGVEKNLPDAWYWLKLALENGYILATDVLIEVSRVITPEQKRLATENLSAYEQQKGSTVAE